MKKLVAKIKAVATNYWFYIGFILTWTLLESPAIAGGIMWVLDIPGGWELMAGWIALTAPSLPIPVIPLSIAGGTLAAKIYNKRKKNQK